MFCLASSIYAQENWGWPQEVVIVDSSQHCLGYDHGFRNPSISSNDSLIFFTYRCIESSQITVEIASSSFSNGQWQPLEVVPIPIFDDYPVPIFLYDHEDTLLYFASDMPGGYGNTDIWASQFTNNTWSQPFNLGPIINSAGIETSPSLPDNNSRLFFARSSTLMYSDKINGQYTSPVALPGLINTDLTETHPRISRDGQKLYFNRYGNYYMPDTIMVSYYSNGQWQEPLPLNGNINCTHSLNCPMTPCSSYGPSFIGDGSRMYYTHFEMTGLICDESYQIWVSELETDIENDSPPIPSAFSLSAYPNPFNSVTKISIDGNLESVSEIAIYDITGRRIRTFAPAPLITWDGTDSRGTPVSSGIYFVKVCVRDIEKSLRITNRQFGLALIIVALILSSGLHAQENWGPPENVIPFSWNDICPIRIYGFSYATISSNDSLMFVNFDCVYTHGVVSTVFENGEWQLPQPIHYQLDDILPNSLFFFDQGDTLLYFVADWTGGYGDEDIWAIQLVNDSWSDPFNLGPQINTAGEENSPSIPDDEIGLYFSRNDNIMYSEIVNGQFTSPVPLPPVINSDLTESHPRISRDGQKLYFNRAESWMHPDSTYVSYFINDTWQEPVPLNSNINCNHVDPNCPMITCSSYGPSFSGNGTKMFFTHFVVYGQFCEPGWGILASELITEVDPPQVPIPTNFSLSA
jgi:hypothetical protein